MDVPLSGESLLAGAGHGPPGEGVVHLTGGVLGARLDVDAGVLAVAVEARLQARAVAVALAAARRGQGRRDYKRFGMVSLEVAF